MGFIERYMETLNLTVEEKKRSSSPTGYYDALPALRELESEAYDLSTTTRFTKYDDDNNEVADDFAIDSFLLDLSLLGAMAEHLLRELSDPDSIDSNKYDYLEREGEQ